MRKFGLFYTWSFYFYLLLDTTLISIFGKEITCPPPPIVPNSRVQYPNRNVGSSAIFTCFSTYQPIGLTEPVELNITCLESGQWSDADFACVSIKELENDPGVPDDVSGIPVALVFSEAKQGFEENYCANVPRIAHGSIIEEGSTSFSTLVGSHLSFICQQGYYLVGQQWVECLPNLTWTEPPICQSYCQNPPIVPDSVQRVTMTRNSMGRYFKESMTVEYVCNSGYVLVTRNGATLPTNDTLDRAVTCRKDGSWTDPPMCLRVEHEEMKHFDAPMASLPLDGVETCGPPPPTRHGNVTLQHRPSYYLIGETALYTCFEGFRLVGPEIIECMPNLRWSMNPTCVSIAIADTCPPPPPVIDAIHVKANPDTGWIAGETVLYLCQRGFHRVGDPVIQCMPKGYWTTPPRCILKNPEATMPPVRMMKQAAGNFEPVTPLNRPTISSAFLNSNCQQPPAVENGYIVQVTPNTGDYPRGTVVTYRCAPNFILYGESSITCTEILLWETPPLCRGPVGSTSGLIINGGGECPMEPEIPLYTRIVERYMPTGRATIGSFVVLDCLPGYKMTDKNGSPIIWCDSNFRWQRQDPPIQCIADVTDMQPTSPRPTFPNLTTTPSMFQSVPTKNPAFNFFTDTNGNPTWLEFPTTRADILTQPDIESSSVCTPPPEIPNGFMVKITRPNQTANQLQRNILYYFGVTVDYVCMTGYEFIGMGQIRCQKSGEWSGIPVCQRSQFAVTPAFTTSTSSLEQSTTAANGNQTLSPACPMPPTINDGIVIGRSPTLGPAVPGSSVEYSCMGDLEIYGNAIVHCLQNGNWEMPPVCVPKPPTTKPGVIIITQSTTTATTPKTTQQQCAEPPVITNGELIYILPLEYAQAKTYFIGTAATYGCKMGFRMIGVPTAYCSNDFTWKGIPICDAEPTTTVAGRCPTPPVIQNGFLVSSSASEGGVYNPGTSVQYQCNPSFRMIGFPRIFCTFELKWEGAPICEYAEPTSVTEKLTSATTATTTKLTTSPAVISSTTTLPTTVQLCPRPPLVDFAKIVQRPPPPYTMGTIARYECAPGYALMGPDSVVCLPFSTWSKPPECVPFSTSATNAMIVQEECSPPPKIDHGTSSVSGMAVDSYSPGSAVVYSCNSGFALIGTSIVLCSANGKWSKIPECVPQHIPMGRSGGSDLEPERRKMHCPEPSPVLNGYRSAQSMQDPKIGWLTGDSFTIDCFPPYVRVGRSKSVCSESGSWSSMPTCVKQSTGNPFGTIHRSNPTSLSSTNSLIIPPKARSQSSDFMSESSNQCARPPAVPHAVAVLRSGAGQQPGAAYLYICEPPYKIQGSPTVICSPGGQWSAVPQCISEKSSVEVSNAPALIYCGPPPTVVNGNMVNTPSSSLVGSVVSYECLPFHQMKGPFTVSCLPNGHWSIPPSCIPISQGQRNNRAYSSAAGRVRGSKQNHYQTSLFPARYDTQSSLLYSAFSTPCYGGPEWPSRLLAGQLSTKLATRELHLFRELAFNCTGLIVEWRYISVLPIKSEPVIVYFGVWRLVNPRGLKYRLVDSTKVTIVGSVRPEETISLKLHEQEFLRVEPGDVLGIHYAEGAATQQPGAIPLAYTFSPSPFSQPQLSSTLASLDDHQSMMRKIMKEQHKYPYSSGKNPGSENIEVDFDNYGFRFFRLPFVRAIIHTI